ncbi:EAL domain-containing protein [Methyloversatilis sp.]|uniref:EAL domain-containing response regulator n=1 Tax=Methyloversatilis sp. TaxID=2569862 RepID=UPI002732BCF0|nr:EAL domain-containing response regulator [Methyloversatilis sp.]MDP2868792.1 EAL domain-containing response regulator [Methyloversatilis sp.]MDP3454904.1 EAL domain-containing response regulator [Methyloversatilis sp.]MDP3577958.1 EAL domain-containing response regulator [Methyloversatilis sp.]
MNVLIIDDDPFALTLLSQQLNELGVRGVQTCDSADMALNRLADPDERFDALFCDLNMPGMDGIEFLRHLARSDYCGGLVLISGEDQRILDTVGRLASARALKLWGALHKPFGLDALKAVLDSALTNSGETRASAQRALYPADALLQAIDDGQLVNHYQPKVEFATASVVGVETLVRWKHPADGLVFPDQFIGTAEAHGLIDRLTHAVLSRALCDAAHWNGLGQTMRVAVNVSMDNLVALDFPDEVARAAHIAGVPISQLVLEVTESQLMRDPLALLDIVARLRLKRIGLSIDDFGTGFSSLAQLRDIPFDELKLDRSFVHGAGTSTSMVAILRANLGMARQLGLRTVAEGVETRADWDCLRQLGCDIAQGYFIARPMPAERLPEWLDAWGIRRLELVS